MKAFRAVFKSWTFAAVAITVSTIVFAVTTWLPNVRLLWSIWSDSSLPIADKLTFPIRLLESITTNFTTLSALYTVAIALLAGINIAFIAYLIGQQRERISQSGATAAVFGILSGTVGMGCAACGSLILTSLLGTVGGTGLVVALPLRGGEFGIIGVVLLGVSTYFLARQITKPLVCEPIDLKV